MKYRIHDEVCSRCGSDNIILDMLSYKCMNCGNRWFESGYQPTAYDLAEVNTDARNDRDKKLFKNYIRRKDVMGMFSPSERFFKNLEFEFLDRTPLTGYRYELGNLLLDGAGFNELKMRKMPDECKESDFNTFIRDYLSSRDELPFVSTIEDWSRYLNVSCNEMADIFIPGSHVGISSYLNHDTELYFAFQIVFSGKVQAFLDGLDEGHLDMFIEEVDPELCYLEYFDGNEAAISYLDKYFPTEINVIKRFIHAVEDKQQELFERAISEHLSIIDTMMQFVDYAFEEYNEY